MKTDLRKEIELKDGVSARTQKELLSVKGASGEIQKIFSNPKVKLSIEGNKIVVFAAKATKREKKIIGSFTAHLKNMVRGVQEPFVYKLKICSGHFPMNVTVAAGEVVIKNFLGESVPRKVSLLPGTEVKVSGNEITVTSIQKELAGQMAARIETLGRITNRDIRVFQDGCFITHKAGKGVA